MKYLTSPVPSATLKSYPDGSIFQSFGMNPADYQKLGLAGHNGLDILRYQGAPIVAVADGVIYEVAAVGDSEKDAKTKFNGNVIYLLTDEIDGKRYYCAYGHLDSIRCEVGQRVKAGDVIGTMGNTGFIISGNTHFWGNAPAGKGVHLHFGMYEVIMSGNTVNFLNSNNGYRGAIDPAPFFAESIKAEPPSDTLLRILLTKVVELQRALIRKLGKEPIV